MSRSELGQKLYSLLFPGSGCLKSGTREIDLNAFYLQRGVPLGLEMKSVEDQTKLLTLAGSPYCTFGSFLENRSQLWSKTYPLKKGMKLIHLGVDINNVVPKQPVTALIDGIVFHVMKDNTPFNGWGGRVITKSETPIGAVFIMYAHLGTILPKPGIFLKQGSLVGHIGEPEINGGWFPHLHLQIMTEKYMGSYMDDLNSIDGYAQAPASMTPDKIRNKLLNDGLIDPLQFVLSIKMPNASEEKRPAPIPMQISSPALPPAISISFSRSLRSSSLTPTPMKLGGRKKTVYERQR